MNLHVPHALQTHFSHLHATSGMPEPWTTQNVQRGGVTMPDWDIRDSKSLWQGEGAYFPSGNAPGSIRTPLRHARRRHFHFLESLWPEGHAATMEVAGLCLSLVILQRDSFLVS